MILVSVITVNSRKGLQTIFFLQLIENGEMEKDRNLWNMSPTVRHNKGSDKDTLCLGNQERSKHKCHYDTEHGVERLKILDSLVVSLLNCPFFYRLFSCGLFYRLEVTYDNITSRPRSTLRSRHLWVSVTPDTFYSKMRD